MSITNSINLFFPQTFLAEIIMSCLKPLSTVNDLQYWIHSMIVS